MDNLNDILRKPIAQHSAGERILTFLGDHDTAAYAATTVGDVIFDFMSINSQVLAAIDFYHPDVRGIFNIASFAHHVLEGQAASVQGNVNQLQGYVFEQMAALALHHTGSVVVFPKEPNNPGWDFLVNGHKVQAKCGISPELVTEHLHRYPGIPRVVVNQDLASHFSDNPFVMSIHGITREFVRSTSVEGLHSASQMLAFHPGLIAFFVICRNSAALARGQTDWRALVTNVPTEMVGRGAATGLGYLTGMAAGSAISIMLGGWPAVMLPHIAQIVGYRTGRPLSDLIKARLLLSRERAALVAARYKWCKAALETIDRMIAGSEEVEQDVIQYRQGADSWYHPLFEGWLENHRAAQANRKYYRSRIRQALDDPAGFGDSSDPLASCAELMFATARSGVLPTDLVAELTELRTAMETYRRALQRRLL
ncbi:MAG: hypothetical protein ACP5NP_05090 [Acetobacteraceae bacterium]